MDATKEDIMGQVEACMEQTFQGLVMHVVASSSLDENTVIKRGTGQHLAMADEGVNETSIQIDQCLARANESIADVFDPPRDIKYSMDNNVLVSIADINIQSHDIKALPIDTGNGNDGDLIVR